ncbi:hypothetical protein VNO77_43624 [Canavalia gladiata]|uniref:Uncharacterized protein n=1 Tax=Canavalia gladiata TaxID=3824 RepID=A0AAN9JWQ5_CANGL
MKIVCRYLPFTFPFSQRVKCNRFSFIVCGSCSIHVGKFYDFLSDPCKFLTHKCISHVFAGMGFHRD